MKGIQRRRWTQTALVVAAGLALLAPVGAAGEKADKKADADGKKGEVIFLKAPSGAGYVAANDVNDEGQIVGFASSDYARALRWNSPDSVPVELPALPGEDGSWAGFMNERGEACGYSGHGAVIHAVVWDTKGRVESRHPNIAGYDASALYAINSKGDAVGYAYDTTGAVGFALMPLYAPEKGAASLLPLDLDRYYAYGLATSINKHGRACGFAPEITDGRYHALVWDDAGQPVDLHAEILAAVGGIVVATEAWKVLDSGEVVGVATDYPTRSIGWVWDEDHGVRILADDGSALVTAWGGAGKRIVGFLDAGFWEGDLGAGRAAVWERTEDKKGTKGWELTLLPTPTGYEAMTPTSCNTSGAIVGAARDGAGVVRGWYLKPKK